MNDEINAGTESNIKTILTKCVANGILQNPTLRAHAEAIIVCLKKTKDNPLFSKYNFNDKIDAVYHTLDGKIRGFENTNQSLNAKKSTFLKAKEQLLRNIEKILLSFDIQL